MTSIDTELSGAWRIWSRTRGASLFSNRFLVYCESVIAQDDLIDRVKHDICDNTLTVLTDGFSSYLNKSPRLVITRRGNLVSQCHPTFNALHKYDGSNAAAALVLKYRTNPSQFADGIPANRIPPQNPY